MIRRLISLGIVVALLGVGDITARSYVQAKVNTRAQQEAPPGSTVSATIGGFPFVPRLLLSNEVSSVKVHIANLSARVIVFASVDINLSDVKLDRSELFSHHKARIDSIKTGTVNVVVTQEALTNALHVPTTIADGNITVRVLGHDIAVTPSVAANGTLALTGTGIARTLTLDIPTSSYVPCIGNVTVLAGRMQFSCTIHNVPPALLDAAQINS